MVSIFKSQYPGLASNEISEADKSNVQFDPQQLFENLVKENEELNNQFILKDNELSIVASQKNTIKNKGQDQEDEDYIDHENIDDQEQQNSPY